MFSGQHPLQNAAQGMIGSSIGTGMLAQGSLTSAQAHAYNQAITNQMQMMTNPPILREDWIAPRVRIEVDRVSNGYVLAVGSERLIAKDLEELQQHFIAQIVSKLVLDESK